MASGCSSTSSGISVVMTPFTMWFPLTELRRRGSVSPFSWTLWGTDTCEFKRFAVTGAWGGVTSVKNSHDAEEKSSSHLQVLSKTEKQMRLLFSQAAWRYLSMINRAIDQNFYDLNKKSVICWNWLSTRKKKHRTPVDAMMSPGTMKDIPHSEETNTPAMREPKMFPTEVWEFHTPMMNPRLTEQKHSEHHLHTAVLHYKPTEFTNNN